jgi:DNA replication licensing factor MCM7
LLPFSLYVGLELLSQFIRHHTILVEQDDDASNNNEDSDDMIPTADGADVRRVSCYLPLLQRIRNRAYYTDEELRGSSANTSTFVVEVPLSELTAFSHQNNAAAAQYPELVTRMAANVLRYHDILCTVIDTILATLPLTPSAATSSSSSSSAAPMRSVEDILYDQRLAMQQQQQQTATAAAAVVAANADALGPMEEEEVAAARAPNIHVTQDFPPILLRRYELRILPVGRAGIYPPFVQQAPHPLLSEDSVVVSRLRQVRAASIGHLVTVTGMVVRVSEVQPVLQVAAYGCDRCGAEIYQVLSAPGQREFLPATACPACPPNQRNRSNTLFLQTRGSKFIPYQELKVQELSHHVPMGHVPRSLTVRVRGTGTRTAGPGDVVTIDGLFLPQRLAESGFRALQAGLVTTTYLEAQHILVHQPSYDDARLDRRRSAADAVEVHAIATGPDPVGRLAASLAPEIFGHLDIKRALLLQLVGGVTRTLPDGMRIRGDINLLLMGDPGVAKSQLLKHVASIAPRGVYTTGKGSSGVGLTAAVTKDSTTGEMALEGGALVLADRGICAIDEFDKMEEADRTALHEVMEQQTVSIAKAGIVATLNARASVLAAANPIYGRYNPYKSLSENIHLPNSLLSRFDLIFLILDIADVDKDIALAKHVTYVHQNEGTKQKEVPGDSTDDRPAISSVASAFEPVPPLVLREYISRARQHHPVVPPEVAPYIVEAYVSLRMTGSTTSRRSQSQKHNDQTVMTARQLLSTLRLSQALARLRFSDYVAREDVDEAIRLTHMSKASVETQSAAKKGGGEDVLSRIFHILRDYCSVAQQSSLELQLCEAMILRKGFTVQQLQSCLQEYESLDVIQFNQTRTHIHFIDGIM